MYFQRMSVLIFIYLKVVVLPYLIVGGALAILASASYLWGQQLADTLLLPIFAVCSSVLRWASQLEVHDCNPVKDEEAYRECPHRNAMRRRIEGLIFLVLFGLTIPTANWLASNVGMCVPNGPCLIGVAPGLMTASGVLMIGIALVLRDLVQRRLGVVVAAVAVFAGAAISAMLAPPALVIASTIAFLVSEYVDLAVYTSLARHLFVAAVLASSLIGLVIDSILFLWLAYGSLEFLAGQIVGKMLMIVVSMPFVMWLNSRDERLGLAPA